MNACNHGIVGVGALGGGDDVQGGNGLTVLGPLHVLRKLVAVGVGARNLDVNAVAGRWGAE